MNITRFVLFLTVASLWAAAPAKKTPGPKSSSGKKAAVVRHGAVPSNRRGKKAVAVAPRQARPQGPSADRYKAIQEALAAKGYLKTEPNGVWDSESAAALKQYQTENGFSPTGKLSSATLIGLGLGASPQSAASAPPSSTP